MAMKIEILCHVAADFVIIRSSLLMRWYKTFLLFLFTTLTIRLEMYCMLLVFS